MLDTNGGGQKMAGKTSIPNKFELFAEAKDYYTKLVNIISEIENGAPESQACRKYDVPISSFREATLLKRKFLSNIKPLDAFEIYKEPAWKLYEAIFSEKLTIQTLPKLPVDLEETLKKAIDEALTDKQRAAINMIYFDQVSYNDAATQLEITSKAVHSLVNAALRNLRAPKYSKRIFYGDEFLKELEESQSAPKYLDENSDSDDYLDKPIDVLEISIRTYNCLRRTGLQTVRHVKHLIDKGHLWKIRNFGAKGVSETMTAVNRYILREENKKLH